MKCLLIMLVLFLSSIQMSFGGDYQLQEDNTRMKIKAVNVRWFDDKAQADACAKKTNGEVFKNEGYHPYVVIYGAKVVDVAVFGGMEMKVNVCD